MHLVHAPLNQADDSLPAIPIRAERRKLAKLLWRATAEDGTEFGFELKQSLAPDAIVHQTPQARYRIEQEPEACLEIDLTLAPADAVHLGWSIGNLHLPIEGGKGRLLVPDEVAVHRLLARLGVPYRRVMAVFQAGRFESSLNPTGAPLAASTHSHSHEHAH